MEGLDALNTRLVEIVPDAASLMWVLFYLVLAYAVIHAAIFVYHWHVYNIAPRRFLTITYVTYFVGIAVFVGMIYFSTLTLLS